MTQKCFVTTPIYYVTAAPHLGSLYSTLLADVIARWAKLHGEPTFFLTGTDEHGQKVAQAAHKAGMEPQAFVDSFIPAYKDVWRLYSIDYDRFIRTTDAYHVEAVQVWIRQLQEKGDIYKAFYQGWYCTPCETFVTEKDQQEAVPLDEHAQGPACASCGRPTHFVAEETYFFRLSRYQDALLAFYKEHPEFVTPKERLNEVINFVESGLKDLSISRTTVSWGIPFPDDEKHVAYVWADALNNYITAIGYGQPGREQEFKHWWPADVQVLGKDIIRFHAIYWPAFLMASGLELPKTLLVHGWIKMDKQKMSKSFGNVVDPVALQSTYGTDPVRYYLIRQMAINQDGDFSIADLEQRIASDLANDLGNLLNRMVSLAEKNDALRIEHTAGALQEVIDLRAEWLATLREYTAHMDAHMFHLALAVLWKHINSVNAYFHAREPWKLAKHDRVAFMQVLSVTAHNLRVIALALWPVMPAKMEELLASLGHTFSLPDAHHVLVQEWNKNFVLTKTPPLFEKPAEREPVVAENIATPTNVITIDDLMKVELVVGTIDACEPVEKSDKLLKMQVNFGAKGMRQILAGIRKSYAPEQLIGKQGVFVFNLKPRPMMGLESHGMMLVSEAADGVVKLTMPSEPVPNGTQLR